MERIFEKGKQDVNQLDEYGNSALMWACRNNLKPVAETLINKGAKVDLKGHNDLTALHHATRNSSYACLGRSCRRSVVVCQCCAHMHV
jgi:ankyrin repeat protein